MFEDVDWSNTKAYAAGYNGLYINQIDRERSGVVSKEDSASLVAEISKKLLSFRNPLNGTMVVKHVYPRASLEIAEDDTLAPDMFIGYFLGIRSSWSTAVGGVPRDVINERMSKWSGDHLFDPSEVPGVLFINRRISPQAPKIIDITPSLLDVFHVGNIEDMDGRSLFR